MRYLFSLSLMLVATLAIAQESEPMDVQIAKARANACIAIAKATNNPVCHSTECKLAEVTAEVAIEKAKIDLAKPESAPAPTPKLLPKGDARPPIPNPVEGATYEWRGDRWVMTAGPQRIPGLAPKGCYIDPRTGQKICPNLQR